MGVDETGGSLHDRHVVPKELVPDDIGLQPDYVVGPSVELLDVDVFLDAVALPVHAALGESGEVENGLTEGLRGDRAAHHADPAELAPLHDHRSSPELRGLDDRLLPGGAASDGHEVEVVVHARHLAQPWIEPASR